MLKKLIFSFSFFLILGCAERGSIITLKPTTTIQTIQTIQTKNNTIPTLVLRKSEDDTLKNNLSGSLVLIIALLLIL